MTSKIDKKGYGIIVPQDYEPGKWDTTDAKDIIAQLKSLTDDAFYRMAQDIEIELDLLGESGYEFEGLSRLAINELEAFLSADKFQEVRDSITEANFIRDSDFNHVFYQYNDSHDVVNQFYSEEKAKAILRFHDNKLRNKRERLLNLIELFIDEFEDDKTNARKEVFEKYGGRFISISELDTFLLYRDDIAWYKGDTFDSDYAEDIQHMKALRDLAPLYRLISEGGEFQIRSTKYNHQKFTINNESSKILAQAIALALKIHNETDPTLTPGADINKTYSRADLICAGANNEVDSIEESINSSIDIYEDESKLDLFYYLADNAIKWSNDITLTQRYLFLYRLAKFFNHIPAPEYDSSIIIDSRKEIVEAIKYRIKQFKKKDKDGELLDFYRQ